MKARRIRQSLGELADNAVPDNLDGWAAIEEKLHAASLQPQEPASHAFNTSRRGAGEPRQHAAGGHGATKTPRPPGRLATAGVAAVTVLAVVAAILTLSRSGVPGPRAQDEALARQTTAPGSTQPPAANGSTGGVITFVADGLYKVNDDGSGLTKVFTSDHGFPSSWSPDGKRFAFVPLMEADGDDCCNDIYVVNADGTGLKRLTHTPYPEEYPAWSPDGKRIAFAAYPEHDRTKPRHTTGAEAPNMYVMNADGSDVTLLTEKASQPAWSPDGGRIAFIGDLPFVASLRVMNADGSGVKTLAESNLGASEPEWSPDGERIAFVWDNSIHVINADGTGAARLTKSAKEEGSPAWSPDGKRITFMRDSISPRLWVMNADGSGQNILLEKPMPGFGDIAWLSAESAPIAGEQNRIPSIPAYAQRAFEGDMGYIRFGGITYRQAGASKGVFHHGKEFATVRAKVDASLATDGRLKDGDSTNLEPGTRVYEDLGYSPRFQLTALDRYGYQLYYEALSDPHAQVGADLLDLEGKVRHINVVADSEDGTSRKENDITDPDRVARLVDMIAKAPVEWARPEGDRTAPFYSVTLYLDYPGIVSLPAEKLELPEEFWRIIEAAAAAGRNTTVP